MQHLITKNRKKPDNSPGRVGAWFYGSTALDTRHLLCYYVLSGRYSHRDEATYANRASNSGTEEWLEKCSRPADKHRLRSVKAWRRADLHHLGLPWQSFPVCRVGLTTKTANHSFGRFHHKCVVRNCGFIRPQEVKSLRGNAAFPLGDTEEKKKEKKKDAFLFDVRERQKPRAGVTHP